MSKRDIYKYGEEILNCINRAAETGDFSNLGRDIGSFVEDATKSFINNNYRAPEYKKRSNYREPEYRKREYKAPEYKKADYRELNVKRQEVRTPFFAIRINRSKGIGKIVAGSIVTLYGAMGTLSSLIMIPISVAHRPLFVILLAIELLILSIGGGLLSAGINNRRIIKNYFKFGQIAGTRPYIALRELRDKTGILEKDIVRQIKKMKKYGFLPYAILDEGETTLMLTDEVYQEYARSLQYKPEKTVEEPKVEKVETPEPTKVNYFTIEEDLPEDVKGILKEGNEYLNKIRYYNDLIPDTEPMSDKLYTLEATVLSIFKKLKVEPEVAGDLRKFMSYYLPTTEKLLQSYVNLRKESLDVENIKKSQREIEEATDVINDAFVKLLNQLFESEAWDISSDISVMKTMMKQDSLL